MSKKLQRKIIKERLNSADISYFKASSEVICEKLIDYIKRHKCRFILSYMALEKEVDLSLFHLFCRDNNITLAFPKVEGDIINFYISDAFDKGAYGILEPNINKILIEEEEADLIIVPLVGFDANRNRLGHGKGFYDRYLNSSTLKKIGVGFELQHLDCVIVEEFDISLDMIISEKGIY